MRGEARCLDSAGLQRQLRQDHADHNTRKVEQRRTKDRKRAANKAKAEKKLLETNPICSPAELEGQNLTNDAIELQLQWHRQYNDKIPLKSHLKGKSERLVALKLAVEWYSRNMGTRRGLTEGNDGQNGTLGSDEEMIESENE